MPVFEAFRKKLPVSGCQPVPEESIAKYTDKLPEPILQLWREEGWCAYGDGLMWFVNPDDYVGVMDEWLETPDNSVVFARNGFGELYTWNGHAVYQLFIHTGMYGRLMNDIDMLMRTTMVDDESLEDSHYVSLFTQATKTCGQLTYDESYTLVPALPLGGEESMKNVAKVKHLEHLLFLAQVHGKLRPA
jgi:hypothetical protein